MSRTRAGPGKDEARSGPVHSLWSPGACSRQDEDSLRAWNRKGMKMKIRVCQGVGGILVVTMVTSFIVMYSSSISKDGSPPRSPLSSPRWNPPVSATSRAALMGYTSVMDRKPLRMHCKTCSLVTSSGQLTGHRRGGEIDQSDCVIRMNDAPTKGFQQDVGQRTDVRVVAHSSLQRVLQSRQQLLNGSQVLIFWGPSSCMRRDGRGQIYNTLRLMSQLLPKLRLFVISRIKMLKFDESFKEETGIDRKTSNSWLSTGWFTMAIALELCDMINVYGMVPPDFCRSSSHLTVPYHYYEPWGPDECSMYLSHERSRHGSHHRFITEKMVFSNWARTLNIHFYQPDWEPAATMTGGNSSPPARSGNPRYRPSQRASGNLWTVSREQISSLATVNVLGSRRTEQAVSRTLHHLAE